MRFLLSVLILIGAASMQTVCAIPLARVHLSIDFLLVCVVCCALLMNEIALLVTAVFAGIFNDCFSAGLFGHSVAVFVPISLMIAHIRRLLWVGHWTTQAGLTFAATLLAWLLYNFFQRVCGQPFDAGIGLLVRRGLINACAAPLFFKLWRAALK